MCTREAIAVGTSDPSEVAWLARSLYRTGRGDADDGDGGDGGARSRRCGCDIYGAGARGESYASASASGEFGAPSIYVGTPAVRQRGIPPER